MYFFAPSGLSQTHAKNVIECPVVFNVPLAKDDDGRKTVHVGLKIPAQQDGTRNSAAAAMAGYEPGDHVGVFAVHDTTLVTELIDRLGANSVLPPDSPLKLQTLTEHKGIIIKFCTGRAKEVAKFVVKGSGNWEGITGTEIVNL